MTRARLIPRPTPDSEREWVNRELRRIDRAESARSRARKGLKPRRSPMGGLRRLLPEDRRLRLPWRVRPPSISEDRRDAESEQACMHGR